MSWFSALLMMVVIPLAGCSLERNGLGAVASTDARVPLSDASEIDATLDFDSGSTDAEADTGIADASPQDAEIDPNDASQDAGHDASMDANLVMDSGSAACSPNFWDIDHDPSNGCEYACQPATSPLEICNGSDDDCDGSTDEEPMDATTYYEDGDEDGHGNPAAAIVACSIPLGYVELAAADDCDDTSGTVYPGAADSCNARDDDCDGTIDDEATCGCEIRRRLTSVYLFCTDYRTWTSAHNYCSNRGYHLVTIDDMDENEFLGMTIEDFEEVERAFWTGLNDRLSEGTYEWQDGSSSTYRDWNQNEPNDFLNEDCAEMSEATNGHWNDESCNDENAFICEAP